MVVFPNAKINIGLQILSKRSDNFHNIKSLMYPIKLFDVLEIVASQGPSTTLKVYGCNEEIHMEDNLCYKAYQLISKERHLPAVDIHLYKKIPMGAGLGGGSSDAAFTLLLLNDLFGLHYEKSELKIMAAQLGSDCAFFIEDKPAYVMSKGDVMELADDFVMNKKIFVVKPEVSVSTGKAYGMCTPNANVVDLKLLINKGLYNWRDTVVNDFEQPVFALFPEIGKVKEKMYEQGAVYASMSGSGSAVYGIFEEYPDKDAFAGRQCYVG